MSSPEFPTISISGNLFEVLYYTGIPCCQSQSIQQLDTCPSHQHCEWRPVLPVVVMAQRGTGPEKRIRWVVVARLLWLQAPKCLLCHVRGDWEVSSGSSLFTVLLSSNQMSQPSLWKVDRVFPHPHSTWGHPVKLTGRRFRRCQHREGGWTRWPPPKVPSEL